MRYTSLRLSLPLILLGMTMATSNAADPASPQPIARLPGPAGTDVAFSRDGKLILTAGGDEARVWDARTYKPLNKPLTHGDGARLYLAALSPSGKFVLTAAANEAWMWDAGTGERLTVVRHAGKVRSAAFSPDGSKLLTAGDDRTSVVWDAATGHRIAGQEHAGPVGFASFSSDGILVICQVIGPQDPKVHFDASVDGWDARSGSLLWSLKSDLFLPPEEGEHFHRWTAPFAFTRDGRRLAVIQNDLVRLHDPRDGALKARLDMHAHAPLALAFGRDGALLALATRDGAVVADVGELEAAARASKLPFVTQESIEYSSKWVGGVTASGDGGRILWALADPQTAVSVTGADSDKPLFELPGHGIQLPAVAFSPDGRRIAAGFASDGFTGVWEVPEREGP